MTMGVYVYIEIPLILSPAPTFSGLKNMKAVILHFLLLMPSSHQRRVPRFKSASKALSFLFTFPKISRSPK